MHEPARTFTLPPAWAFLIAIFGLTYISWPLATGDMETFLLPWMRHILDTGPIRAFAAPFSNYTPPYLYLLSISSPIAALIGAQSTIKLVSVAGSIALGLAVRHLALRLEATRNVAATVGAATLALPTVLANTAILTQCDAIWSAAAVMALAAAVERRHVAVFAWCGIAAAFKAQAVLVAPFFLALALARGVPFRCWLAAPLAFAALMLPAALAGWPIWHLATVYFRQADECVGLSLNAPNLWAFVQPFAGKDVPLLDRAALLAAVAASGALVLALIPRLRRADAADLVAAAALACLLTAGLLPRMHERYFFLADVLTFVLAVARPAQWRVALYTQAGSVLAVLAYLSGRDGLAAVGAASTIAATYLLARSLLPRPAFEPASLAAA